MLQEFDVVRIASLRSESREFDGSELVRRPPRVGDVGTICCEIDPGDPAAPVVVEMVNTSGYTVWVAEFVREELELVSTG